MYNVHRLFVCFNLLQQIVFAQEDSKEACDDQFIDLTMVSQT